MCMYTGGCIEEKGTTSSTGRWRKQSYLGTTDLVLVLSAGSSGRKKRKERGGEGAVQGRATVMGRKRGTMGIYSFRNLGMCRERKGEC